MNKSSLILAIIFILGLTVQSQQDKPQEVVKTKIIYKLLLFPEECYQKFFVDHNFFDFGCLTKTLSKGLSIAIVVLSLTLKVPQIIKIMTSKSVAGLSFESTFNESFMYAFSIAYNLHQGTEFMLYGENIFILVQNWILLFMHYYYNEKISATQIYSRLVFFVVLVTPLMLNFVPDQVFIFSIYINMILNLVSKGPQILMNYKNQSTGQLAFITQFLSLAGALTRAFTYLVSSSDYLYNLQNLEALGLNGIIVSQFVLYRKKKIG